MDGKKWPELKRYTTRNTHTAYIYIHTHGQGGRSIRKQAKGGSICLHIQYRCLCVGENASAKTGAEGTTDRRNGEEKMKTDEQTADADWPRHQGPVRLCGQEAEEYGGETERGSSNEFFFLSIFFFYTFFFFALYHNKRLDVEGVVEKQHPLLCVCLVSFCFFFFVVLIYILPREPGFSCQIIDHLL